MDAAKVQCSVSEIDSGLDVQADDNVGHHREVDDRAESVGLPRSGLRRRRHCQTTSGCALNRFIVSTFLYSLTQGSPMILSLRCNSNLYMRYTCIMYTGWPKKSKPPPIFQKIVLRIANEIRFLCKVKV